MDNSEYKDFYVFIEQREGKIQSVAVELLGKARDLADMTGEKVVAVLLGHNIKALAKDLISQGADLVLIVDNNELEHYLTEPYTQAITQIINIRKPSVFMIGATTIGRDLGPRLSARLQTGLTAYCTKLENGDDGHLLMTRPAFGGNLMATIVCKNHRPQMSTVRPGVMKRFEKDGSRQGFIEEVFISFDKSKFKVKLIKQVKETKGLVDIADAKILISGGRGVQNAEGFNQLKDLASVFGAEVSASRALVDAGVIDHNRQVGQTGKTVRPNLYIACGISGAIQHLAGMEESEFIVAINKDKSAPIFQTADLGIVGDVNKIIPLLTQRLKSQLQDR